MENILYILDNSSTNELEIQIKNEKNYYVLALNFQLKKNLEKIGIKTIDEQDFLNFDDYEDIDRKALDFSRNWFVRENLEQVLEYNGINIGLMLQNEIFQNLLKYLHRIKLIEKILCKINPKLVLTVYSDDIMGKIPKIVCLSKNIKTEIIQNISNSTKKTKFEQVNFSVKILGKNIDITVSKKQFKYLKKIFEIYWNIRFKLLNIIENKSKQKGKSILFLDFNLIWHESFLDILNKKNYKLFFLNNRRPIIWNYNSLNITKKIPIIKVNLPKIEKDIDREFAEFIRVFELNLKKNDLSEFFKFSNINFGEIFLPELEKTIVNRSKDIMILISKVEKFLENEKIDLVWTLDDWGDDRVIVKICKQNKIPTCILLSGSIAVQKPEERKWIIPSIIGERIADKQCVWGENDKKKFIEANYDMKKIEIGGAPRYDKLFCKENIDDDYILILTGGLPSTQNSYFYSTSFIVKFEKLFEDMLNEVKKFEKRIIIKRHPTQGPQEILNFQKICSKIVPNAIILKDANTIDLISKAKIVISIQSTVIEESIILDKPIIYLPYINNDNGIPYVSSGAVIEVSKSEEIFQAIHDCLFDNSIKEKLRLGRKNFLEKTFSFQNSASERHLQIMEKLLDERN